MSEIEKKAVTNEDLFDSLIGKQFNNIYQIEEKIGVGGMGAVFRATNLQSDEVVAIKVIFPELATNTTFIKRFEREAKVCWMLSHPNIVKVYEFGLTENNMLFMVMEYIEGTPLDDYLEGILPLSPTQCFEIIKPLCSALEMAHRHSILHRDLKPSNILISKNDQGIVVKLVDFGVAKLLEEGIDFSDSGNLTLVGQTFGTPHYMAPELLKEEIIDIGPTLDLYSLGTIVYEMLSGELPCNTMNLSEVFAQKIRDAEIEFSKKYPFIPKAFDPLIKKILAFDPKKRYQSAEDFIKDFEALVKKYPQGNIGNEENEENNSNLASSDIIENKEVISPSASVPQNILPNSAIPSKISNDVVVEPNRDMAKFSVSGLSEKSRAQAQQKGKIGKILVSIIILALVLVVVLAAIVLKKHN